MNSDIRLQMSFYSNTKVKKLQRLLGSDAVLSLVFLWLYTAENRPHGELRGMDIHDIALAGQYPGEAEVFVSTLHEIGFLNKRGKLFSVHDWEINNPWAANAPERKKQAQDAAKARWLKNKEKVICSEHADSMLPAYAPSPSPLPSPLPFPSPSHKPPISPKGDDVDFNTFWKAYPKKIGKDAALKAWKKIPRPAETIPLILTALEWQKASLDWTKENGQFIPNPSTYLNQGRWKDELLKPPRRKLEVML